MSITIHRPLRVLGVALAAALAWAALAASSAHALTSVVCDGSEFGVFSPNLTDTPRSTDVSFAQYYTCGSLTHPTIRSGRYSNMVTLTTSCGLLTAGGTRTRVIRWNTGETSTFTFNAVLVTVGNEITATRTGTITAGKFDGATAIEEAVGSADLASCGTTGLDSYSATTVLTITGL